MLVPFADYAGHFILFLLFKAKSFRIILNIMKELPKVYEPKKYEEAIYRSWQESGYFNPDNLKLKRGAESFSIVLPPPNVTGKLHLGHASMLSYQDIMIRYHRLKGDKTLWLPGMDHAAIATQNVVEKELNKEKKTRYDLGREKFLSKVNQFAKESRAIIREQLKKMGSSLDWSRERFTLDKDLTRAVRTVFKKMHDDGLIYRGDRVVNWCPKCQSTLADDEVNYEETLGKLYYIKYNQIVVATTRPETKLGDTGVAVNPQDARYKKLIGQELKVDLAGQQLKVKVFADRAVDMDFGSGAIGVTPAHSQQDFAWAEKYRLPIVKIIDEQGKMTRSAGKYQGLTAEKCRQEFVADLTAAGLIEKIEDYTNNLSVCYRCSTPIEPLLSKQWFVAVNKKIPWRNKTLKQLVSAPVRTGKIKIIPNRFNKTYFQWVDNLKDWCISRQIWYGHRIPVWYKEKSKVDEEEIIVPKNITELVAIRHGITDWNKEQRVHGEKDVPLDEASLNVIKSTITQLQEEQFDLIITSPLKRAHQTAEIINQALKLPLVIEPQIRERDFGEFEGKTMKEIKRDYPGYLKDKINYDIPGEAEESYEQLAARVEKFLQQVGKKYPNQKILIVSHTAVIRTFKLVMEGLSHRELTEFSTPFPQLNRFNILDNNYHLAGFKQDEDTLDTWFSSALWTFSTLGWPDKTKDLKEFHPTSVLETMYDILFFWVARMIMMSEYLLKEEPFTTVYLHAMVKDKLGRKMSKSLGNGIDPLAMIAKFGADALRLSMIIGVTAGADVRLYEEKIAGYRNFVNKLWNISRYILLNFQFSISNFQTNKKLKIPNAKTLADEWILSELDKIIESTTKNIEEFKFSQAGEELYEFTWSKLADWYLEIAKIENPSTGPGQAAKDELLLYILEKLLILWHPFCPFVTEVIWQEFHQGELLMVQQWPACHALRSIAGRPAYPLAIAKASAGRPKSSDFKLIQEMVSAIRNVRAEQQIEPKKILNCAIISKEKSLIKESSHLIEGLAKVKIVTQTSGAKIHLAKAEVILEMPVNEQASQAKEKEIASLINYLESQRAKLDNGDFLKKAPQAVIQKERAKLLAAEIKLNKLLG